jgi:hypothetical protein
MREGLRIVTPFAVALVVLDTSDHVYQCAPIFGYMLGWSRDRVKEYCGFRNWNVEVI